MPKRTGSIASEAERLSKELGRPVTVDQVRWWRKQEYDLNDTPGLIHHLRNQERVSKPKEKEVPDDGSWPPTVAYQYLTDEAINAQTRTVPVAAVLKYLRDQWESNEVHAMTPNERSTEEQLEFVRCGIRYKLLTLRDWLGVDIVADSRDEICDSLWPD